MKTQVFLTIILTILSLSISVEGKLRSKNQSKLKHKQIFIQAKAYNDPYNINDEEDVYYAEGVCSLSNCDNCVTTQKCKCPSGYAQNPKVEVTPDKKSCQYKLKKQSVFFILELIFPFGAGHFYAGRILHGCLKICILLIIVCSDFIVKRVLKAFQSKQNFNIGMYAAYFAFLAWQMVDIICIGINYFKDGKGLKLKTI